jgi:hypothetical protein
MRQPSPPRIEEPSPPPIQEKSPQDSDQDFSEFDIEDRTIFSEIIENSKFSIFLANSKFENVNNYDYFNNLSKKIKKNLLIVPFVKKYQENFTKNHNYYILY